WRRACEWVETMREHVTESVLGTSYLSTLWLIAYLYGRGISLEAIRAFFVACRPLLVDNFKDTGAAGGRQGALPPALVAAARNMAAELRET
ncbi:MAG: hypothetical protein JW951_05200, partial [Lentisphaerae bacterium]|nr:hypothetical protein [Lentisphaerota bacterium]